MGAPPAAWDAVEDEACYDVDANAYHWSVAVGPREARLAEGFSKEWGDKNPSASYVAAQGGIELRCAVEAEAEADADEAESSLSSEGGPAEGDRTVSLFVFGALVGAGVILVTAVIIACVVVAV